MCTFLNIKHAKCPLIITKRPGFVKLKLILQDEEISKLETDIFQNKAKKHHSNVFICIEPETVKLQRIFNNRLEDISMVAINSILDVRKIIFGGAIMEFVSRVNQF